MSFAGTRLAIVTCALVLASARASAQDAGVDAAEPATSDPRQAEALVLEARTAVEQARLADARRLLERAFELEPSPAVGFNLGLVLRDLGELVAARAMFERILGGELGELPDDRRTRVDELLREVSAGVVTLMVAVTGPPQAEVRLDGELVGTPTAGETLRLSTDPGEHVMLATAPGFEPTDQRLELARGDVRRVDLTLASIVAPAAVARSATERGPEPEPAAPDDGGSVLESPWLWAGVVLAVGAAIAVVFVATSDGEGQMLPPAPEGFLGTITTP